MRLPIAALIIIGGASSSQAGYFTGNDMHAFCQQSPSTVLGYVTGWSDKMDWDTMYADVNLTNAYTGSRELKSDMIIESAQNTFDAVSALVCVPKGATAGQLTDVFCKFLANNPETRQKDAQELVATAFRTAWPCQKK